MEGFPIPTNIRAGLAGPLWIGYLWDAEFLTNYFAKNVREYFSERARELSKFLIDEAASPNIPYALTVEVGRDLGRELPVMDLISIIRGMGYQAFKTHFHIKGFRTDASLLRVKESIAGLSK
nr:MAG: hypothetical protein TU36_07255 [Vulcanisaeta sp. AZ3]